MGQSQLRSRLLSVLFLLSVFLLALNKIDDTDAWMHLSMGRAMWAAGGMPAQEMYVYPGFGKPAYYGSWFFGLVYYSVYRILGLHGVVLLKALTILAVFAVLLKDSLRPRGNLVVAVAVLTAVVLMARPRFVERPDTFLMFFLAFSIFCLNAYVFDNKKYLYVLPVMHLLWANTQTSVILMAVPFGAFIAGGIAQRLVGRRLIGEEADAPGLSNAQIIAVAAVLLMSFACTYLTPERIASQSFTGVGHLTSGMNVLASKWWKQEILELRPPAWGITKWPYAMTAAVLLSFVLNWRRFSFIHFFLVAPLMVLQFTAIRFVFLFGIVSAPVFARNVSAFIASMKWDGAVARMPVAVLLALWIVSYTGLAIAQVAPFGSQTKAFGFGINMQRGSKTVPEAALSYLDGRRVYGRVFNSFEYGGYISWRDFPGRTVFVDPRGPLSDELLELMLLAPGDAGTLDKLYRRYGFSVCLLEAKETKSDIVALDYKKDMRFHQPDWALVYWDDNANVYLRRGDIYDSVIEADEYRHVKPNNGPAGIGPAMADPSEREGVIRELQRNIRETGSVKAHFLLGAAYNAAGRYAEAVEAFHAAIAGSRWDRGNSYYGMAFAYLKLGRFDDALSFCRKALDIDEDGDVLYLLSSILHARGDMKGALTYAEKAVGMAPGRREYYPVLIDAAERLGLREKAEAGRRAYDQALRRADAEASFARGTNAYMSGDLKRAITEYEQALAANPGSPSPYSNLGFIYYDLGDYGRALDYQQQALRVDPKFANAHYGIALAYKRLGDVSMARRHWQTYLQIEPGGYYSRKVLKELEAPGK